MQQKSDPLEHLWRKKRRLWVSEPHVAHHPVVVDVVVGGGIRGRGSHPVFGWTLFQEVALGVVAAYVVMTRY